jgi:hypothetical protein
LLHWYSDHHGVPEGNIVRQRRLALALVALACSPLAVDVQAQTTWYVDDDTCPEVGTGTEADPFCSIQVGIDSASDTDMVLVEPGTYYESIDFSGNAITLQSTQGREVTTIDATGLYDTVVRCASGEGEDTVLDGFTITGGDAMWGGGGMYNEDSSPTVVNCTFDGNEAYYYGGGMYNGGGAPTVSRCTFSGNSVHLGAGMYNSFSSAKVTNCTFEGNPAIGPGGGMYNVGGTPEVGGCTFSGNSATEGAGMFNDNSSPTVSDCTFEGNSALYYDGGGIYNHYSSPTVTDCVFIGNSAGDDGAGMCNSWDSSPSVTRCTFEGNTAHGDGGGGGMSNRHQSNAEVTDCAFTENSADYGGAMYSCDSNPTVTNSTFTGNWSPEGRAMAFNSLEQQHPSHLEMTNCIVWDGPDWLWNNDGSTLTITFSDVQGGWTNDDCPVEQPACNMDADPLFVPGPDGCLYLSQVSAGQAADSPCVDTGSDTAESLGLNTLTTRSDEVVDNGIVDMGYHYPVTNQLLIMGDYDRSGTVDLADFAGMQNCFTGEGPADVSPCCRIFDFEPDGDVDLGDYHEFEAVFGQ